MEIQVLSMTHVFFETFWRAYIFFPQIHKLSRSCRNHDKNKIHFVGSSLDHLLPQMCDGSGLLVMVRSGSLSRPDLPILYPVDCAALWNEASHHQSFLQRVSHSHPTACRDLNTAQQHLTDMAEQRRLTSERKWADTTTQSVDVETFNCKVAVTMSPAAFSLVNIQEVWASHWSSTCRESNSEEALLSTSTDTNVNHLTGS